MIFNICRAYHEQVVLLEGFTTYFLRPQASALAGILRSCDYCVFTSYSLASLDILHRYGISENTKIYLFPHTIMKYSPAFIDLIRNLIDQDDQCTCVFLYSNQQRWWYEKLRILVSQNNTHPNLPFMNNSRIVFLPKLSHAEYYGLLQTR